MSYSVIWEDSRAEFKSIRMLHHFESPEDAQAELDRTNVGYVVSSEVVDFLDLPADRTFRNVWGHDTTDSPDKVSIDLIKAKAYAHEVRRARRAEAFVPHDAAYIIPSSTVAAEASRAEIRKADAANQISIDNSADLAQLKTVLTDTVY